MRQKLTLALLLLTLALTAQQAQWVTSATANDQPNVWQAFRHTVPVTSADLADDNYQIQLAADTKYWLYVNGELIVREGGLKRGPYRNAYYVDTLNLGPHLTVGENTIGLLLWYFGKQGFSHQSSGFPGFWLDGPPAIRSSNQWRGIVHRAFIETEKPHPNYRLPESNIGFDATHYDDDWKLASYDISNWPRVRSFTEHPVPPPTLPYQLTSHQRARQINLPGHRGELRPFPQWKNWELLDYENPRGRFTVQAADTFKFDLPYNAQITPYFRINAPEPGMRIEVRTDNYYGGSAPNVRTVYYTRAGTQSFETPGWMNGHEVWYILPAGVEVLDLRYRESGYPTEFSGRFVSNDAALNTLWTKAQRTLFITMRDSYMDCPDRERAQWWGDVVNELGETFYSLDRDSDLLTRKAIQELMHWQRADSTIYSPVPAGNWDQELPTQMLASVSFYGIWHYYYNTGDADLIADVYPAVKRYLDVWETHPNGLVKRRKGGWTWGDWGENKDMELIFNTWYYVALQGLREMAQLQNDQLTVSETQAKMDALKAAFHPTFWTGSNYRSPNYKGQTDDRPHALAVVSGLAPTSVYPQIFEVFRQQEHASPYFEKYVLEALCRMGHEDHAVERMKKRFGKMIDSDYTTLFEGWGIGKEGYGGGTYNHAWSGGGLTVMSQYLGGGEPTSPGWATYRLRPGGWPALTEANTSFETVHGPVSTEWTWSANEGLTLNHTAGYQVPYVEILLPENMQPTVVNGANEPVNIEPLGVVDGKRVWRTAASNFTLRAK